MRRKKWFCAICLLMAFMTGCGEGSIDPLGNVAGMPGIGVSARTWSLQTTYSDAAGNQQDPVQSLGSEATNALTGELSESYVAEVVGNAKTTRAAGNGISAEMVGSAETIGNGNEAETEDRAEAPFEEERELTEQELKKLQWSIRSSDHGFFVCMYYRPEEIDWQQVLSLGAGMNVTLSEDQVAQIREKLREERLIEEQKKAELMGIEPVEEDPENPEPIEHPFTEEELALNAGMITALTPRSVQNFVKNRTGLDYSEARKPLEWQQLGRNLIYFIRGESNGYRVELMSGKVCGNIYELTYRKAGWAREKKPEFVMRAEIENGKWKFISNLPIDQAEPKTLADIEFLSSKELARMQGVKLLLDVSAEEEEDYFEDEYDDKSKTQEPTYYWAVITATEDDCKVSIDRVYRGDEISKELMEQRIYVPGENLCEITLGRGEKIGVKVTLEDVPKLCVRMACGNYFGTYVFGAENHLKRFTKEGFPLSTYLYGRDLSGEKRGTEFTSEAELLRLLEGTWLFYDSEMGEYTASCTFDAKGGLTIHTLGYNYVMAITGFDRIYADVRSDPPDLIKLKSTDEETLELFTKYYPSLKRKVGDYHVKAVQKYGMQMLILSFENNGKDGLCQLLPGADALADEIVLYRFVGASEADEMK